MMTDDSVLEWVSGWLRENPPEDDPTFRQRLLDGLGVELRARRHEERLRIVAWLRGEDARRYTEVGPLVAQAIVEGRHLEPSVVANASPPLRPREG